MPSYLRTVSIASNLHLLLLSYWISLQIVVPLAGEQVNPDSSAPSSIAKSSSVETVDTSNVVTALYTFQAETSEDLTIMVVGLEIS